LRMSQRLVGQIANLPEKGRLATGATRAPRDESC
jgi:hypothetical protein